MNNHNLFYYPYATFGDKQKLLLKAAALYFDKLYMLDPLKASWEGIGTGLASEDIKLLQNEQILVRVAPEEVLHKYEKAIAAAISADMKDHDFLKICDTSSRAGSWTLALAKIPKDIREDPQYKPFDTPMQRLMGEVPKQVSKELGGYSEEYAEISEYHEVYDEYREADSGAIEYRYADFPLPLGESIMINHALFGGILYTEATPLTDDNFHHQVLTHKIKRAMNLPVVREILQDRSKVRKLKSAQLAVTALTDLDLSIISPDMPMEEILKYRHDHKDELEQARKELGWLAREIRQHPWSHDFGDELESNTIPKIRKLLAESKKARNSWLKSSRGKHALKLAGLTVAAASATVSLAIAATPLLPVAIAITALGLAGSVGIPGVELALDWKAGKKAAMGNGLHYLMNLK